MSKEFAKRALRKIVEFEGKDLIDIFKMTEKEVAYIVTPAGRVQKVVGKTYCIPGEWLKNVDFREAAVFHTHPRQKEAELSEGDVIASLERSEKNTDGEGIIGEEEYRYWEISKGIAKGLLDERRKIIREWDEAKIKFDEEKAAGRITSAKHYAKIVSSCIHREPENIRKTEELALIEVLSGRTENVMGDIVEHIVEKVGKAECIKAMKICIEHCDDADLDPKQYEECLIECIRNGTKCFKYAIRYL